MPGCDVGGHLCAHRRTGIDSGERGARPIGALTFQTLGEARIFHDGDPCNPTIRKALALAIFLAVTGKPHPRARLVALLWPEADDAHGLLSLRQTLARVRQMFGPDADEHLLTPGDLVSLALGPGGRVDVADLAEATDPQATAEQRARVLMNYRAGFLDGFTINDAPDFATWADAQHAHWGACYDLIAGRQLQYQVEEGRAEAAVSLGRTWVARRPDCEQAYRLLAQAQIAAADVGGARLTLTALERQWMDLGLELTGEAHALKVRLAELPDSDAQTPRHTAPRTVRLPLIGRDGAMAQLRQVYQLSRDGSPQLAVIVGEAGLGKSRLLRRFARWAEIQGADIAIGRADELSGRLPYQPLAELLQGLLAREHAPDDLLDDVWLSELTRLVPDLRERYPDLATPQDDPTAGTRLLESVARLGMAMARRRPVLWLVDDLHWTDEATRSGLRILLKRWRDESAPVLLALTARAEEIAASPELSDWIASARAIVSMTEITLSVLSGDQSGQVVAELLGGTASDEFAAWLHDVTQGNPLYLTHVVQALIERGAITWQHDVLRMAADVEVSALGGWLPETLRGVLLRSVKRLDPAAQQTLAAAAVLGTRFNDVLLAQVAGVDEQSVLAALDLAERRLLIRADEHQYRFAHDKVAEAVYGDMTLARRRAFHRRALQALESTGHAPPGELARHAVASSQWATAIQYSKQAAEVAEQIGAYHDAIDNSEQILLLLTTPPSEQVLRQSMDMLEIASHYESLGMLYAITGQQERSRDLYNALLVVARHRGDVTIEGRALLMMARLMSGQFADPDAARELVVEAMRLAHEANDTQTEAQAEYHFALALQDDNIVAAWEHVQHALSLARDSGSLNLVAKCLAQTALIAQSRGWWEIACVYAEECLMLLAHLTDGRPTTEWRPPHISNSPLPWTILRAEIGPLTRAMPAAVNSFARQWGGNTLMWLGARRLHLGEGDTGRAALHMGWQIFAERNERRFHYHYLLHRTLGWLESGEYERAIEETTAVIEASRTSFDKPPIQDFTFPLCASVDAHHAVFHLAEADASLKQALALAAGRPLDERLVVGERLARHHALAGKWEEAFAAAIATQETRAALSSALPAFDFTRYYETESLLRGGDRDRARAEAQRLGEHLGGNSRFRLVYLRMHALLDRDADDHVSAVVHLRDALELATAMGLPGEAWQIAAELSASYAAVGETEKAAEARLLAERTIAALAERITDRALREHFTQAALSRRPALS